MNKPLTNWQVILVFLSIVFVTLFFLLIRKIYYYFVRKQRYYIFPKISVKGITNIAMVISISVATILLLTIVTAGVLAIVCRAYPGWRVTIEGILIKIGGLLFGPIIGIFIGGTTDLLTVGLTSGMFHYGYFVSALAFGFFSGIIKWLIVISKNNKFLFCIYSTIYTAIVYSGIIFYVWSLQIDSFTLSLFNLTINVSKLFLCITLLVFFLIFAAILWICCIFSNYWKFIYSIQTVIYKIKFVLPINRYRKKLFKSNGEKIQHISKKHLEFISKNEGKKIIAKNKIEKSLLKRNNDGKWFTYFAPVLVTVFSVDAFVEIFTLPVFDQDFSILQYDYWLAARVILFVPMTIINLIIIFSVYRIVCPTIRYDYKEDLLESKDIPLMIN